jgi:hypothetical protein
MGVRNKATWARRVAVVALAVGSLALASASPAWATTTSSSSSNPQRLGIGSPVFGKSNSGGSVTNTAPGTPGGGNGSGTPGSPGNTTSTPPTSHTPTSTPPPSGNTNSASSTTDQLTAYYNNCSSGGSTCNNSPDCTSNDGSGNNACGSSTPPNQGCVSSIPSGYSPAFMNFCATPPSAQQNGFGPGTPNLNQVGWGPNYPSPECAWNWSTSYGGATYPMSGDQCAGPVTTRWIKAVCNGSQTSGTVSFDISESGQVPYGGPYVPEGPYTSSFTVPSCSPAAQENPVSITWKVKGPHYPNDTVNGQGIAANWRLVPVVSPLGLDVPIAPDLGPTIHWNGFSSGPTVTNYAKNQILGPNTQALIGHTLPQWITTGSEPNQIISAANTGHSAPVVTGKFYVRTFKGRPMNIEVTGSYTAIWGHWYFKVTAIPTGYQATYPYQILIAPGYWEISCTSYKSTRTGSECTSTTSTWVPPVYEPVTFYYPTGVSPSISNVNLVPLSAHKETFPVSADIKVRTYRAVVTAGG